MIKACKHCEIEFNVNSRQKRLAGGYINECPDCVEARGGDDSAPKHLGVAGPLGDDVSVVRFDSQKRRDEFQNDYNSMKTIKDFL